MIKQGAVLVLKPGSGLRGGYCIQAPNRVSQMRRDEGGIFKRSGEIYVDQYVRNSQTVTIVFGLILILCYPYNTKFNSGVQTIGITLRS